MRNVIPLLMFCVVAVTGRAEKAFDLIIRHGTVIDGSGRKAVAADVGLTGEKIAAVGDLSGAHAAREINASGLVVAPGFINMLSWATESLIQDGRSQSDLRQGVTTEIMGEGSSMGPLTDKMKKEMVEEQGDIKYPIEWTTLGQYLDYLVKKGIGCNGGSFVGATTLRVHEVGYADRPPTPDELQRMKKLTGEAMQEGALGVGSSLIYAPAFYARTDELIELCRVASQYQGMYISHIRSEGNRLLEAADELIRISREAKIPAEIYHLKAAGKPNWGKLPALLEKIEKARASGLKITADMYTYIAAGTGLDATMPPWVQEGGLKEWIQRLKDPEIRKRVREEMSQPTDKWENFFVAAGSPENILLVGFKNPALKPLTGRTLAEVANSRGKSAQETAMDLVIEDNGRVDTIYFLMTEDNLREQMKRPWVSFGSDESSLSPDGVFLKANPHPRAYGNVARLLGKYVREEKIMPLEEAIRRLTSLPAGNLRLKERGELRPGFYADVVIFNPDNITDHATFAKPHAFATGVKDVFVNGVQTLRNGEHTGALPGQVIRGPGWKPARVSAGAPVVSPLTRVHAHNDYEHIHPLRDALDHGFCSVEADIHLVDGELLVAHDRKSVEKHKTLEALYLRPLREQARRNGGRIFPGGPVVDLLIDLKSERGATYAVLAPLLEKYADILTRFEGGQRINGAVLVILTGDRSRDLFSGQKVRFAALDGDLPDLASPDSMDLVPWISANWSQTFKWNGFGKMPDGEQAKLQDILNQAHARKRRVRFWGSPDFPAFWSELLRNGVDLINTDDLLGAREYFLRQPRD